MPGQADALARCQESGDGRPAAGTSLGELVQRRLAELTAEQLDVVELLALGEPLTPSELAGLASDDALVGRKVLVVRQTPKAHAEVTELLQALQTQPEPTKGPGGSPQPR